MNNPVRSSADYQRNRREYDHFWSSRWRRTRTYSSQTKLKRFRALMRRNGLRERVEGVFDQGFGLGLMLFSFPTDTRIAGLEMSDSAVAAARAEAQRLGFRATDLRVYNLGMEMPAEWNGAFDLVISSHVLEHLAQPGPALDQLVGMIRPGGHACIIVPVNEEPGEDLNHFHHFTERSFAELLRGSGLEIVEIRSCDRLLNLIKPVAFRLQRGPSLVDRALSIAFNAVFGVLPYAVLDLADRLRLPRGWRPCQCFALCRKP